MAPARRPKKLARNGSKALRGPVVLKAEVRVDRGVAWHKPSDAALKKLEDCFKDCLISTEAIRSPFHLDRQCKEPKVLTPRASTRGAAKRR